MDKPAVYRRLLTSLNIFVALLCVALLSSCATTPKKELPVGHRESQWHGSFSIKDKETNKSNSLVIDALAREPSELRLEITTQLGIPIASIAINHSRIQALLPQQKKYIEAPANAESMGRIARMAIEPQVLIDIFFDNNLAQRRGWSCDNAQEQRCAHAQSQASVTWSKREGNPRQFEIDSPRADGHFSIKELSTKVEFDQQTFKLNPPASYSTEKL